MNTRHFVLAALAAAALAACSTVPDRNDALVDARTRVSAAQSNPQVATLAPDELQRATASLRVAEKAWSDGGPTATVNHLSYMTVQRVAVATQTASSRASQAVTAGAAADRDKMRLAARTDEAEVAQRQLAASQQNNAQKAAELAAAEATAVLDRDRVERSRARAAELEAQLAELNAKKTDRGIVVTLGDVLFDSGKSRLLPDGARNMAKLAAVFKGDPQPRASIEGYTDSVGSSASNIDLSQRRADAVMAALVREGVAPDHLSTYAYGEENPTADNGTATGRQMNRRVEIVFAPQRDDIVVK
ncbi:OmpA family protein [Piscinibacter sp.]|uniref:OmpA family protein n=1 Tax=Piscinibacter sp. TaxID=1903157 RepID=UPI002B6D3076|nr:OmpA family protein [Albitalea sp.]HUG24140.1 OmpA family protein [Albitalea sp.]